MRKQKGSSIVLVGLLAFAGLTQEASALPMFTAQTGMDCTGCHTQIMPRLNKFGRKFAASGMTMSQQVSDMNEEHATEQGKTSDMDLNPSMLIKSKYAKTWDKPDGKGVVKEDDDTNDGDFSPVRMATLSVGGRVNENVGGMLNLGWRKEEDASISGRVTYANEIEDGYWGVTAYSTSTLGPFSGMEFYNTGLYKPLRTFDMHKYSNASISAKVGSGAATGLQVYYDKDNLIGGGDHFFITAGIYTPGQDNADVDMRENILPFARIAYEHPIGDYNVMIGAFIISGGDSVSPTDRLGIDRETYGMDMQIEGDIVDREASLTLVKNFKNKVEFSGIDAPELDSSDNIDNESFSVDAALSVTPSIVAKIGYMTFDDKFVYSSSGGGGGAADKIDVKDLDYAINLGVDYGFTVTDTPIKLAVEYAWMNPELDRVKNYESFMVTLTLPL
jgi:hypothetical protein